MHSFLINDSMVSQQKILLKKANSIKEANGIKNSSSAKPPSNGKSHHKATTSSLSQA
jgi:hypothetical protein